MQRYFCYSALSLSHSLELERFTVHSNMLYMSINSQLFLHCERAFWSIIYRSFFFQLGLLYIIGPSFSSPGLFSASVLSCIRLIFETHDRLRAMAPCVTCSDEKAQ